MKKRMIPVVMIVLVAAVVVFWTRFYHRAPDNIIPVSGNIELTTVDISFKVAGKLVERTVDEGDPVRKGQLIARLDAQQGTSQRDAQKAGLEGTLSQLQQLRTAITMQRATLAADLQLRKADLAQAEANLRDLQAGSRPQEIQQAEAAVAEARARAEQANKDWERAQVLFKNDDISAMQFDQYRERYRVSQAALRQGEERLALVREGPRRETIEAARAAVARAQAGVRVSEANHMDLARREQEVEMRRADIERSRALLSIAESQLGDLTISTPVDGVVMVKSADPGEVLAAGTTVVSIGDLDHPWLRAYINEPDLGKVKLGQRVKLRTDSYPGKVYWGRISFISPQAEFTPKQIQTKEERVKLVYRVKIVTENAGHELKENMPVDGEIEL
ncbi:MAG: efflux RND transporter periplasmic adaptor subunit [Acidobacteria bacterium]|nr:efflux RND transporter periplasmic adaptor subunit [Acidobacteriota bacterium]